MNIRKSIKDLTAYPVPLFDDEGYLKLNSNENNFGPSPKVLDAIKNIKFEDIQYYPYFGNLLKKLADFNDIDMENIILTVGGDEAIHSVITTFSNSGDKVLSVVPTFSMPMIFSKICGLDFVEISYKEKWVFPKNDYLKKMKDVDFIYLTTPNSPTGDLIDRDVIEEIVEKSDGKPVLIDETYTNYSGVTNIDLIKNHKNIFIIRSFSKDFALAGLRLGYVISAPENIVELRKYLSPYNVSNITLKAGISALEDFEYFKSVKSDVEKVKAVLTEVFENLGGTVYPSSTNFLCVDMGEKSEFIYKRLLDCKIKVKYFKDTPMLENCFRVGCPNLENLPKVLRALEIRPTIAFDMDGVLVDASKSYRVAVQETFKHFTGREVLSPEISEVKKLGGLNNDWDLTQYLLKKYGFEVKYQEIVDYFQSVYEKLADVEEILVNKEFFEKLSEKFNLAIFTGRLKEEAYFTLKKHGLEDYFSPVVTLEDVGMKHQKPDVKGIEIIKQKVVTDKIYYLGDTIDDMICAKNAGVVGIGVLPPQDKSDDLKNLLKTKNAMLVLNRALDLVEMIEGIYASKL